MAGFSYDSRLFFTASERKLTIWDPMTGQERAAPLEHPSAIHDAAFGPGGRRSSRHRRTARPASGTGGAGNSSARSWSTQPGRGAWGSYFLPASSNHGRFLPEDLGRLDGKARGDPSRSPGPAGHSLGEWSAGGGGIGGKNESPPPRNPHRPSSERRRCALYPPLERDPLWRGDHSGGCPHRLDHSGMARGLECLSQGVPG